MTRKILVTVPYQHIEKVSLRGSGYFTSNETIKAVRFSAAVAGSGEIYYKGNPDKIDATSARYGDIINRT